jgi:hypothetical protein
MRGFAQGESEHRREQIYSEALLARRGDRLRLRRVSADDLDRLDGEVAGC